MSNKLSFEFFDVVNFIYINNFYYIKFEVKDKKLLANIRMPIERLKNSITPLRDQKDYWALTNEFHSCKCFKKWDKNWENGISLKYRKKIIEVWKYKKHLESIERKSFINLVKYYNNVSNDFESLSCFLIKKENQNNNSIGETN